LSIANNWHFPEIPTDFTALNLAYCSRVANTVTQSPRLALNMQIQWSIHRQYLSISAVSWSCCLRYFRRLVVL